MSTNNAHIGGWMTQTRPAWRRGSDLQHGEGGNRRVLDAPQLYVALLQIWIRHNGFALQNLQAAGGTTMGSVFPTQLLG